MEINTGQVILVFIYHHNCFLCILLTHTLLLLASILKLYILKSTQLFYLDVPTLIQKKPSSKGIHSKNKLNPAAGPSDAFSFQTIWRSILCWKVVWLWSFIFEVFTYLWGVKYNLTYSHLNNLCIIALMGSDVRHWQFSLWYWYRVRFGWYRRYWSETDTLW